jgi:hypothetical protein
MNLLDNARFGQMAQALVETPAEKAARLGYQLIPKLADPRGRVCGECGMVIKIGEAYGMRCPPERRCPAGFGW